MNHKDILAQSATLLRTRSEQHGAEEDVMDRACKIFENITGTHLSLYEASIFMHSYEMARMKKSFRNLNSVLNGIDYLALAGQFADAELGTKLDLQEADIKVEADIKAMAAKLSPALRAAPPAPPQGGEGR
jgi:hypothetical protein